MPSRTWLKSSPLRVHLFSPSSILPSAAWYVGHSSLWLWQYNVFSSDVWHLFGVCVTPPQSPAALRALQHAGHMLGEPAGAPYDVVGPLVVMLTFRYEVIWRKFNWLLELVHAFKTFLCSSIKWGFQATRTQNLFYQRTWIYSHKSIFSLPQSFITVTVMYLRRVDQRKGFLHFEYLNTLNLFLTRFLTRLVS